MTAVEQRPELQPAAAPPRRTPYQGLLPYAEEDADYFFGRSVWCSIITDHLLAYRVTLLYGPSGVGKSSVLRAGVLHELRKTAARNLELTDRPELLPAIVSSWSGDPIAAIEASLAAAAARLWPTLPFDPPAGSLAEIVSGWADRAGGRVLLVLDQFDEFFMYHETRPGGLALVDALADVSADREIPLNVLISIREDALAKLDRFQKSNVDLWQNLLRIDHLDADAAREAIERPIERWNERAAAGEERIALEPGLAEAVVAEANARAVRIGSAGRGVVDVDEPEPSAGSVEAPYLQLVMTRLWEEERRRGSKVLRVETLNRMGGAEQIVRRHFDGVMRELSRRQRSRAAKILQYLVTPAGTKIALPPSALAKWSKQKEKKVVPILATLAGGEQRILRTVSSPGDTSGATSYEIFHDRLAPGILDWRRRYVRRKRRLRAAVVLVPILLFAGFAGLGVIVDQRQQNQRLSEDLARFEAEQLAEFRFRQADMKARASRSPFFARMVTPRDYRVWSADFSPDGRRVATGFSDGTVAVASTVTGRTLHVLQTNASVERLAYGAENNVIGVELNAAEGGVWNGRSADFRFSVPTESDLTTLTFTRNGRLLVSAGTGVLELWSVSTGKRITTFGRSGDSLDTATISPDGHLVASARGLLVRVWDVHSHVLRRTFRPGKQPTVVQFTPDGRSLLTISPGRALLWNIDTARRKALAGGPRRIDSAGDVADLSRYADFADGKVVISGTRDAVVWSLQGKPLATLRHPRPTTIARFSPDGSIVVTATDDGAIRAWSVDGRLLATLLPAGRGVGWLAFRRDGRLLVSAHAEGAALLWKVQPDLAVTDASASVAQPGTLDVEVRIENKGLRRSKSALLDVLASDGTRWAFPVGSLAPGARWSFAPALQPRTSRPAVVRVRVTTGSDAQPGNNSIKLRIAAAE